MGIVSEIAYNLIVHLPFTHNTTEKVSQRLVNSTFDKN